MPYLHIFTINIQGALWIHKLWCGKVITTFHCFVERASQQIAGVSYVRIGTDRKNTSWDGWITIGYSNVSVRDIVYEKIGYVVML